MANGILAPFNLQLNRRNPLDYSEGFDRHLAQAEAAGMDVNDWLETTLGWLPSLPMLERSFFPNLNEHSIVCEIGAGTGRQSRHIAKRIPHGRLYLVERSQWAVKFLGGYFAQSPNVSVHESGDCSLPFLDDKSCDAIFSGGTFIEFQAPVFLRYFREFHRVLRTGGIVTLDYIDPLTQEGLEFLLREATATIFNYHSADVIRAIARAANFDLEKTDQVGKSTYVTLRKS